MRTLSPREVDLRLAEDFSLLSEIDAPGTLRHSTMEQAIEWSFRLLEDDEQLFALHLSALPSDFDVETATFICDRGAGPSIEYLLDRLASKSIVTPFENASGESRYAMLRTVREYLFSLLADSEPVLDRLVDWALDLCSSTECELSGASAAEAVRILEGDLPLIRCAFEHAISTNPSDALTIALRLHRFWVRACKWGEGRRWVQRALDFADAPLDVRAEALNIMGSLSLLLSDFEIAKPYFEEALEIVEVSGQANRTAAVNHNLAIIDFHMGDRKSAERRFQRCVEIYRSIPDERALLHALSNLGNLYRLDESSIALPYLTEALCLAKELDDRWYEGMLLVLVAKAQAHLGQQEAARRSLAAFIALKEQPDAHRYSLALNAAVELAISLGEPVLAIRWAAISEHIRKQAGLDTTKSLDLSERRARRALARQLGPIARQERGRAKQRDIGQTIAELQGWLTTMASK